MKEVGHASVPFSNYGNLWGVGHFLPLLGVVAKMVMGKCYSLRHCLPHFEIDTKIFAATPVGICDRRRAFRSQFISILVASAS